MSRTAIGSDDYHPLVDIATYSAEQPSLFPRATTSRRLTRSDLSVFLRIHDRVRSIDGLHDDEALDELCKCLYLAISLRESAQSSAELTFGSSDEASCYLLRRYVEATERDIKIYAQRIAGYRRSRGVFDDLPRLSAAALSEVAKLLLPLDLTASSVDLKGEAFQALLAPAIRSGMGQYFTPTPVVDMAIQCLAPTARDLILDPFCGSGAFLTAAMRYVQGDRAAAVTDYERHQFLFHHLHGIEKSDRMVRVAMTDMRLLGDGHSNLRNVDALLDFASYPDLAPETFSIVVTNPPFGASLGESTLPGFSRFAVSGGRKSTAIEVLGLERSLQFLEPGGRMAIVLPDSLLAGERYAYVRAWLSEQARIVGVVSLPIDCFQQYGALHKTSLVILRKFKRKERFDGSRPTFLAGFRSDGHISNQEVHEIAERFKEFRDSHAW